VKQMSEVRGTDVSSVLNDSLVSLTD